MKKQPNITGSLLACYHFDTPCFMLCLCLTRLLTFLPPMASSLSVQMLAILASGFYPFSDGLFL